MGSLVFRECDDESDFSGKVHGASVHKAYGPRWGRIGLEDLVVCGIDDITRVWLDPLCEDGSEEFLLCVEGAEGEVLVCFGVIFGVFPEPVTVDRWLYT